MNTLKLNGKDLDKDQIIKEINKHRLSNKNNWYQVEINYDPFVYKLKAFNTWVQIIYCYKDGFQCWKDCSVMDQSVKNFKEYLYSRIK